jgi:hypothetical protein
MSDRERYRCILERDRDGAVLAARVEREALDGTPRAITLNSNKAPVVVPFLHQILRDHGISGRVWSGRAPIELSQVTGAQVELLLRAVKPMRRPDRIEEVAAGIAAMAREEASYWYAKAERPRGLRVLRLLLSDDGRRR